MTTEIVYLRVRSRIHYVTGSKTSRAAALAVAKRLASLGHRGGSLTEGAEFLQASIPREGWRPIRTAPKDRRILLGYPMAICASGVRTVCGEWDDDRLAPGGPQPYWTNDLVDAVGDPTLRTLQPTCWRPLPDDPPRF